MRITFLILALIFGISGVCFAGYVADQLVQKQLEMDDSNISRWQSQIDEAKADKDRILNDTQANAVVADTPYAKAIQAQEEKDNPFVEPSLDVQASVEPI